MFVETPFDVPERSQSNGEAAEAEALGRFVQAGSGAFSDNTERALRSDLAIYAAWCAERGLRGVPAVPETVAAFVDAMGEVTWQLLLAGFHDLPGWEIAPGRRARPFLGAGLGIAGYRLGGYVQRFPEPDDPQGPLRRGPGREIPFTALPGGSGRNFTWMLTAGIAIPIGGSIHLELSYRYTDAGEIRTDVGDIAIVRYREDGTRREIPVRIDETAADYRTHAVLAAIRFEF